MVGADLTRKWILGQYHFLPVIPGRMECAEEVRRNILTERPAMVAVQLPTTLEEATLRAARRLPEVSLILYQDHQQEGGIYVPVEITDPFMEALRSAWEVGAQIHFVDPDLDEHLHPETSYPDIYAARRISYIKYVESYLACPQRVTHQLIRHTNGIAWRLQQLQDKGTVLVVISLNLLGPVMKALGEIQAEPLALIRRSGVQVLNLHPECLAEVLVEPPFVQAVYEKFREKSNFTIDETSLGSLQVIRQEGPFRVISHRKETRQLVVEGIVERTARHVNWQGSKSCSQGEINSGHSEFCLSGYGFRYIDRQRLVFRLVAEAELRYRENGGESLSHWQRRLFARYARNLAFFNQQLIAGLFDLTVAARSIVDDNFAWELWEMASLCPHQRVNSDLMTVNISGEELYVNMRRIHLRRRLPRRKTRVRPLGLRERKKEKLPGEWARQFNGSGICSYPPEDIVLENYGSFLKRKGKSLLSEERFKVEPFSTSLLDGVDVRETMRNWYEGKLYVREFERVSGEVGAVVVVFNEDLENRYHWCTNWLGEHAKESDMAFYSTNPYDQIVGPGIARAEYGGFLLSYPPRRMLDIWHDQDYQLAESKPEILLLAALDYTLEKFVVYVAARPPRSVFRTIASRMGRKIVYVPIGQLSPVSLKKIRVVHVLDGHDKRETAKDFIW